MSSTPPSTETPVSPEVAPIEEKEKSVEPTDKAQDPDTTPSTSTSTSNTPDEPEPEAKDGTATAEEATSTTEATSPATGAWQAIFSPQHNAYYFYNHETQQTTWENPLVPSANATSASSTSSDPNASVSTNSDAVAADPNSTTSHYAALHAAAIQAGIDPSLAHLDPTLLASIPGAAPGPGPQSFTAKFNARTGQFARPDARDPSHLSEHARAVRMSEFYFDVKAWEDELAQRGGALMGEEGGGEGKKRKRPSKKDLERFKEQKRLKKIAKTAWLRT